MNNQTPRHIQEAESDRRSIKDGWYATNKTGQICSNRFLSREDCQAYIEQGGNEGLGPPKGRTGMQR